MPNEVRHSKPVVPNRGAAKRCKGCCKIWNDLLFIDVLLHKVYQIVLSNQLGVPPNFFKGLKDAANQKRLKNTALSVKLRKQK
jgi:hypothetical protein